MNLKFSICFRLFFENSFSHSEDQSYMRHSLTYFLPVFAINTKFNARETAVNRRAWVSLCISFAFIICARAGNTLSFNMSDKKSDLSKEHAFVAHFRVARWSTHVCTAGLKLTFFYSLKQERSLKFKSFKNHLTFFIFNCINIYVVFPALVQPRELESIHFLCLWVYRPADTTSWPAMPPLAEWHVTSLAPQCIVVDLVPTWCTFNAS